MKVKQTILGIALMIAAGGAVIANPQPAAAANCGGVQTAIVSCGQAGLCDGGENPYDGTDPGSNETKQKEYKAKYDHNYGKCKNDVPPKADVNRSGIWGILIFVLNVMLVGVGVAAVGGIVYAGVLYVTAADSPEQVKKAKSVITNVVIGLITFGLMYSALNWLIPGGLFS